jgi:hypothetical protein
MGLTRKSHGFAQTYRSIHSKSVQHMISLESTFLLKYKGIFGKHSVRWPERLAGSRALWVASINLSWFFVSFSSRRKKEKRNLHKNLIIWFPFRTMVINIRNRNADNRICGNTDQEEGRELVYLADPTPLHFHKSKPNRYKPIQSRKSHGFAQSEAVTPNLYQFSLCLRRNKLFHFHRKNYALQF